MKPEEQNNPGMMEGSMQGQQPPTQGSPKGDGKEQLPPELQKQVTAYNSGISQMLHNPKSRDSVYKMLKNGTPEVDIPRAALTVNKQMEKVVAKNGKPPLPVLLRGGVYLVGELIDIGHAGGFFQLEESQVGQVLQDTMQQYIQAGLKDKSIDPVELQEAIEPMLNEEQRANGSKIGQEGGMQERAGGSIAMEQYANQKVAAAEKGFLSKQAGEAKAQRAQQGQQAQQAQAQQQQPQGVLQGQGGAQ